MKKLLLATAISVSAILPAYSNAQALPQEIILETSHKVLDKMKNYREKGVTDTVILGGSLLEDLEPVVDFENISKAVMGKYYEKATVEQVKRFTPIFKKTMAQLYAKTLVKLEIDNLQLEDDAQKVTPEDTKGKIPVQVKALDGASYSLVYSVRKGADNSWKVRNIVIDGINLGLTYRNQFYSAADQYGGDIDKVINNWSAEMDV